MKIIKLGILGDYLWSDYFVKSMTYSNKFKIVLICHSQKKSIKTYFEKYKKNHIYKVPIYPFSEHNYNFLKLIKKYRVDVILSVAFSTIISKKTLNKLNIPILNIHPSYLPNWRGPDPIRRQILNGDKVYGITLHQLISKIDSGNIIFQKQIVIDQIKSIEQVLYLLYLKNIKQIINQLYVYMVGIKKIKKQEGLVSYAPFVKKSELIISEEDTVKLATAKAILSKNIGKIEICSKGRIFVFKDFNDIREKGKNYHKFDLLDGKIFLEK